MKCTLVIHTPAEEKALADVLSQMFTLIESKRDAQEVAKNILQDCHWDNIYMIIHKNLDWSWADPFSFEETGFFNQKSVRYTDDFNLVQVREEIENETV